MKFWERFYNKTLTEAFKVKDLLESILHRVLELSQKNKQSNYKIDGWFLASYSIKTLPLTGITNECRIIFNAE